MNLCICVRVCTVNRHVCGFKWNTIKAFQWYPNQQSRKFITTTHTTCVLWIMELWVYVLNFSFYSFNSSISHYVVLLGTIKSKLEQFFHGYFFFLSWKAIYAVASSLLLYVLRISYAWFHMVDSQTIPFIDNNKWNVFRMSDKKWNGFFFSFFFFFLENFWTKTSKHMRKMI